MIEVSTFSGRKVAVFGLGRSGLAAARALKAGGADVGAWDDDVAKRAAAEDTGIPLSDHAELDWSACAALVLSPGVPLSHPEPHWVVELARRAGCEIIGDVELFARERLANPVAAITGTNGKSTTTALTGFLIDACGREVAVGGNLGTSVLDLPRLEGDGVYVIEMSSYQIDLAPSLDPEVAVLLNISADHLDRHGGMDGYVAVKQDMLERQSSGGTAIVGVDDEHASGIYETLAASRGVEVVPVSVADPVDPRARTAGIWVDNGVLRSAAIDEGAPLVDLGATGGLVGVHNWQNAAAALAAAVALGCPVDQAAAALLRFPGLAHRMEFIAGIGRARFINDSKATNAEAAAQALRSFERIIWIAGGRAKEGGISSLQELFPKIETAFLIGEAADDFAATLEGRVSCEIVETLEAATSAAAEQALAMDTDTVVLLSPAAASFDQFKDFEARGERFRELVLGLAALHASGARAEGQA